MTKLRCGIYARVSTDANNRAGQNTANQLVQLRQFALSQGWEIVIEYSDQLTGKNADRDAFQRMLGDAGQHQFDVLLFWALDRLTREGPLKTLLYLKQLADAGVKYKSFTEQYLDSLGIFGDAIVGVLAAIAKQESVRMSERIKAGLATARREGKQIGRPGAVVDMVRVAERRQAGESLRSIAQSLRVSPALLVKRSKIGV
jgi:DNA invertase Pin-like site-specific DNA recombinase